MFGFYTPVMLLQAFCIYHAYRNHADQRWYWFILLFPLIGAVVYLYRYFYNRRNIESLAENFKVVLNANHKIETMEKELKFADTLKNRVALADAYGEIGRHADAIKLYEQSLVGFMADDPALRMKLMQAHFLNNDYSQTIALGHLLSNERNFKNSEQCIAYAWSLYYDGKAEQAEKVFIDMDKTFTNYKHRLEFGKFLLHLGRTEDGSSKLKELLDEFDQIRGPERKFYRDIIKETNSLYTEHQVK